MFHLKQTICPLLVLAILASAGAAQAATYWVAKTGNNANTCAQAQNEATPKLTIAAGIVCLVANNRDTLIIKDGTYVENILDSVPTGNSWANATTVKAQNARQVIVQPSSGQFVLQVTGADRKYIIFDGLVFDGINVSHNTVKVDGNTTVGFPDHIRITNSMISNSVISGLLVVTMGSAAQRGGFNEFINNDIHDNGRNDVSAPGNSCNVYIQNESNLIEGNDIHHSYGCGITLNKQNAGFPDNNIVRNNRIHDNGQLGIKGFGIVIAGANNSRIYNNLIYNNKNANGIGIYGSDGAMTGARIYNNTIYGNESVGIRFTSDVSNSEIKNNIVYNNAGGAISNSGTGNTLANNTTADPSFLNVGAGDFRLLSGSVAIDAGQNLAPDVTHDFAGTARPVGLGYDIGAYEQGGGSVPPPADPTGLQAS